jgi:tetratricopeptide (TPR) repeat protein
LFSKANAAFVEENYIEAAEVVVNCYEFLINKATNNLFSWFLVWPLPQLYSKAIEMDSQVAELYINRAHIMQKLGRYQDSKTDASTAISLSPTDPKAHLRMGVACFHLEQYTEALNAFQTSCNVGGKQWLFLLLFNV